MKKIILFVGVLFSIYVQAQQPIHEPIKGKDYDIDFDIDEHMFSYDQCNVVINETAFGFVKAAVIVGESSYYDASFAYPRLEINNFNNDSIKVSVSRMPLGGKQLEFLFNDARVYASLRHESNDQYWVIFDKNISFNQFIQKLKTKDQMAMRMTGNRVQIDVQFIFVNNNECLDKVLK